MCVAADSLVSGHYRVTHPDRQHISGTGLGLFIVREIIQQHGGRVWATSPGLGQGSTFGFALPIVHDGPPSVAREALTAPTARGASHVACL